VEPVRAGQMNEAGIRQVRRKALYVSPFLEADMTYHFRILPPGEEVALRILETDAKGPILAATFHGHARPATTSVLVCAVLNSLGIPWKVISAIHFEALKLWLKGLKLQDRAGLPPAAGHGKEAEPQDGFVANRR
jgi:hypothetical protein